jgi:hypothetical protein
LGNNKFAKLFPHSPFLFQKKKKSFSCLCLVYGSRNFCFSRPPVCQTQPLFPNLFPFSLPYQCLLYQLLGLFRKEKIIAKTFKSGLIFFNYYSFSLAAFFFAYLLPTPQPDNRLRLDLPASSHGGNPFL